MFSWPGPDSPCKAVIIIIIIINLDCLQGVRVNSINPGVVETPIALAAGLSEEGSKRFQENAAKANPLNRIGTPHDIAAATLFLADPDKAGWITGQTLVIDGGQRSFAG